jgi:hypothetical protein
LPLATTETTNKKKIPKPYPWLSTSGIPTRRCSQPHTRVASPLGPPGYLDGWTHARPVPSRAPPRRCPPQAASRAFRAYAERVSCCAEERSGAAAASTLSLPPPPLAFPRVLLERRLQIQVFLLQIPSPSRPYHLLVIPL